MNVRKRWLWPNPKSKILKRPLCLGSLLACGVITGVGAVVMPALRLGQDVVVISAGGVGLNAIQGARIAGARRIVAVDMSEEKLEIAKEFGATDGVLATGDTPWRDAKKAIGRGRRSLCHRWCKCRLDQAPAIWDMGARLSWWACQNRAKAPPMNP